MKSCPTCNRTYADDTITFCLVDGSILSAPYDPHATLQLPDARATDPQATEILPPGAAPIDFGQLPTQQDAPVLPHTPASAGRQKSSHLIIIGVVLVGVLALAGIGALLLYKFFSAERRTGVNAKVAPPEGQVLRYFIDSAPETLDPQLASSASNTLLLTTLFDGLLEWDSAGRARPSLATSWERNADATMWTFRLRNDAKWTDGSPITAQDFVYSWKRALSPALKSPNAVLLYYLKDAAAFNEGKASDIGARALDDYTLQVTLAQPTPFFDKLVLLPIYRPVPRRAIERWGNESWATPERIITSGAFKLLTVKPGELLIVERNTLFWDNANTKLDRIIFRAPSKTGAEEDPREGFKLYEAGEVDSIRALPRDERGPFTDRKDFIIGPAYSTEFLVINLMVKPLDDVRVRRALSMAIDRQALTSESIVPSKPLTGFVPPLDAYEGARSAGYDPEQARRLLSEAGFPGGRGFPEIELLYNISESNKKRAEFVQASLQKELGIRLTLNNQDFRTFLRNRNARNFKGLARSGWIADYADASAYLQLLVTDGDLNAGWTDAKYDQLLRQANAEPDAAKRASLLREAESYLLAQQPVIPLSYGSIYFLRRPYVKNLFLNAQAHIDWRSIYIDHAATE